jgi:hypothetical protein
MYRHMLALGTMIVLVGSTWVGATAPKVVGVVSSVAGDSLHIKTRNEASHSVRLDVRTEYIRWITAKPWGQDNHADRRALDLGRCVQIDVRADDASLAKRIWVSVDAPGTFSDPCKAVR